MLSKNRRLPHQMPQKSLQANFIADTKSEPHPGGNDGDGDKESREWREQAVEHHSTVIGPASLVSSYVRVHSCTILLNGLTSPFWVSGGMGDADHSMVFVECSHQSPSSPTLLPLRLSQRLLSSSLDICADSLSGTAIMDINRGGNLVCQNTSFTRSKRTEPAHSYQHHIQQKEPEETSLSFFLCTFKDIPSNGRGGGLKSSFTLLECCGISSSALLPDPTITASLQSVGVEQTGDDTITFTATLSQSITGQLFLLVDNTDTTLDPSQPCRVPFSTPKLEMCVEMKDSALSKGPFFTPTLDVSSCKCVSGEKGVAGISCVS
ncbi:hypothetical protein BLNAU_15249 [Blattamonas nauphoetae]|uniref:Uncharacterized protein n=1 Tax=Blattamonas nauphoetae TaxID=2049346 RepID=A0ABQ9XG74_9EUKA|nr:hypothetical protein BLNAU_15249 [Blattamonas nauphoetae]